MLCIEEVRAVEFSGAWAPTHADECGKVFIRKGRANEMGFTAMSDQRGGGFIIEAGHLWAKFATCKIKTKKEDGQTVNSIAGCATDILLSNVQFSLKVLEPILRIFPGTS